MKGPKTLLKSEDNWVTDIGMVIPGERVIFRGKDLFRELNELSWMAIHLYGITGRFFSQNQLRLFEAMWVISVSYPDPRIWNNRVAALAGTVRCKPALAVSAAMAVTEASVYGHRPSLGAMHFLMETKKQLDEGSNLRELVKQELKQHRKICGYGRPRAIRAHCDERIEPLLKMARQLELADGIHLKLALAIDDIMAKSRLRWTINVGGLAAALCADQGLTPRQFLAFLVPAYIGGMTPCYLDALTHPEGSLFPLRCSRINYLGKPPRSWD